MNQSSTVHTRLNSSVKAGTSENLHLSSALSEINFKQKKQSLAKEKGLGSQQHNSISHDGSKDNISPKAQRKRQENSARKKRQLQQNNLMAKQDGPRVLSGVPNKRHSRTQAANSLSIGPQPHINRLKRFFCDNLDKQNIELAGKI